MSFYAGSAGSVGSVVMQPQQVQGSAYGMPMAQSVQMAPGGMQMQMMPQQGIPMTQSMSYAHHVPPPIQVMPMTAAMPRPQYYQPAPMMAPLPPMPHTAAPVMYAAHPGYAAPGYGYYGQQPTVIVSSSGHHRRHKRHSSRHGRGFFGYL